MELIRDTIDKQLVDRRGTKIGKVDGLVAELRQGEPPRIAFIEIGSVALARRLGPRLGWLVSRVSTRLGGEIHREPYRVSWEKMRDIGVDIELDLDVHETTIFAWQDWLRDHIIGHIPGA